MNTKKILNKHPKSASVIHESGAWNSDNGRPSSPSNLKFFFEGPFTDREIKEGVRKGDRIKKKHIDHAYNVLSKLDKSGKKVLFDKKYGYVYGIRSSNYKQGQAGKRRAERRGGNPSVFR